MNFLIAILVTLFAATSAHAQSTQETQSFCQQDARLSVDVVNLKLQGFTLAQIEQDMFSYMDGQNRNSIDEHVAIVQTETAWNTRYDLSSKTGVYDQAYLECRRLMLGSN